MPNVAVLTAVVALDYLRLRFKDAPWVEPTPALDALRAKVADRLSPYRALIAFAAIGIVAPAAARVAFLGGIVRTAGVPGDILAAAVVAGVAA